MTNVLVESMERKKMSWLSVMGEDEDEGVDCGCSEVVANCSEVRQLSYSF